MAMRKAIALFVMMAALLHSPASALEKRSVPLDDDRVDSWSAGATCRVNYYNICTGWIWCWSGFGNSDRFGLVVNSCIGQGEQASLLQSVHFLCTPAPSGYGFTGTIAVHNVDENDCPVGGPIASQPYLPQAQGSFFQTVAWPAIPVPSKFALIVTTSEEKGIPNPATFGTDRPAAGPSGPQACGTCYPMNRTVRSFMYGPSLSPICPGSTFNDGVCAANLFWDIDLVGGAFSVEESSWGKIKSLYR